MKNKISFSGIRTLYLSERETFSQHVPLTTTLYVRTAIGRPHVRLMMFGRPIRVETYFRPKMFGPDQAEAQKFAKICSDQHPGSSLIIGGPAIPRGTVTAVTAGRIRQTKVVSLVSTLTTDRHGARFPSAPKMPVRHGYYYFSQTLPRNDQLKIIFPKIFLV